MLGDFIMAPATEEVKEEQKCVTGEAEVEQPVDGKDAIAAAAPASSWWGGLGSVGGIAAVVRAQLDSVVQTATLTDWRAELSTLREGLQDEGTEAVHAARGAVQQLPSTVERVAARLPATPAVLSEHVIAAQHAASAGLHRLVEGTSHLFDQVSYAIQSELGGGSEGGGADAATEARAPSVTTASTSYSRLEADVAAMQRDRCGPRVATATMLALHFPSHATLSCWRLHPPAQ